ncbi:MAG: SDR family oxidoreductase [Gemmatimonadetes bacterium]|nr:SDR family oxidoreductase [Gemmatimonadota bacterium]
MNLALTGKRVLITGSSRGIGAAIAQGFLAEGASVVLTGRDPETLKDRAKQLAAAFGRDRVHSLQADLAGSESDIQTCVDHAAGSLGGLDVLVANVGSGSGPRGLQAADADWERLLRLNLVGTALACRHSLSWLTKAGGGSIVLVASIGGMELLSAPLPYTTAKAGLIALSKALAWECAAQQVRVNCVSPGNILHEGGSWEGRLAEHRADTLQYIKSEVPLKRFGKPEEIANAVLFLASDVTAGFVTGANLVVDGGQTRGW